MEVWSGYQGPHSNALSVGSRACAWRSPPLACFIMHASSCMPLHILQLLKRDPEYGRASAADGGNGDYQPSTSMDDYAAADRLGACSCRSPRLIAAVLHGSRVRQWAARPPDHYPNTPSPNLHPSFAWYSSAHRITPKAQRLPILVVFTCPTARDEEIECSQCAYTRHAACPW